MNEILKIYDIKAEIIRSFSKIKKELLGIKDITHLLKLPAWAKYRLKEEYGNIEIREDGYGGKILVITLEDPNTGNIDKKERKTAFTIYFSYQTSKPLTPSQVAFKLNSIYKVVHKLRLKGYHVFPALVVNSATPGARLKLEKHKVHVFQSVEEVMTWIYSKLLKRLQKLIEITKFTFKFDKIFSFLKTVIEGLGFDIPTHFLEAWAIKPKYPH
jgi:hypothetical protein